MNKKAADISLNIIIVAAIALIVLVVLVMIFTGRMNIFGLIPNETQEQAIQEPRNILKHSNGPVIEIPTDNTYPSEAVLMIGQCDMLVDLYTSCRKDALTVFDQLNCNTIYIPLIAERCQEW